MMKKGELAIRYIVMIIVLLVSFAVLVYFLIRLDLGATSNKQICHNSVLLKSRTHNFAGELDCRTNYLCISGGDDCEGISATQTIRVKSGDKSEIMRAIADEIADCWWMFGEGRVDYVGVFEKNPLFSGQVVCSLCSVLDFEGINGEITYGEFLDYLEDNSPDGKGESYLKHLFGVNSKQDILESDDGCGVGERLFNRNRCIVEDNYIKELLGSKIDLGRKYKIVTSQFQRSLYGSGAQAVDDIVITKVEKEAEDYNVLLSSPPYIFELDKELGCTRFVTKA